MAALTPREMRIIADHVERVTKARIVNQQLGVDPTPDLLLVRFPNGYEGTLIWTPGSHGANAKERAALTRHTRHRDGYHLDTATIRVAAPRPSTTVEVDVTLTPAPDEMRSMVRGIVRRRGDGHGPA